MSKTPKGQIHREGVVSFGDASLSVWEESIPSANSIDGFKKRDAWELAFKRQVFARIVQTLNRIGWTCKKPTINAHDVKRYGGNVARRASERKRFCVKGDLKADLEIAGRSIELKMFQSVNCPTRPDHEGRYESNKEACMPYLVRLEMERTRRRIRDYLCNVFTDYEFESSRRPPMWLMGLTAEQKAAHDRRTSGHYKPALDRAEIGMKSNAIAADGGTIEHGAHVWAIDYKGRVITGTAYYDLNNNWDIVTGRYGLICRNTGEIFAAPPEQLRDRFGKLTLKRNDRQRRKRLEGLLADAVKRMDFDRAKALKSILFPTPEPLFHIMKGGAYFAPNYCGYRDNAIDAGKYTEAELKPYASDIKSGELRAVPIDKIRQSTLPETA